WGLAEQAVEFTVSLDRGQPFAFAPDDRTLVVAASDHSLHVYDYIRGRLARVLRGHAELLFAVGVSADGKRIFSGDEKGNVWIWAADSAPGGLSVPFSPRAIRDLAALPEGRVALGGWASPTTGFVQVLDGRGAPLASWPVPFPIASLACDPSGRWLALGGTG